MKTKTLADFQICISVPFLEIGLCFASLPALGNIPCEMERLKGSLTVLAKI